MNNSSPTRASAPRPRQAGALALTILLVLGLCFGVSFTLNKLAITNGVPVIPFVFWQSAGATLIILAIAAAVRQLPAMTGAHLRIYVVMALLNVAIPYLVLSYVAPKLPASLLPIVLALTPGVIYLMALALGLERFGVMRFAGICIGLVGVLVILLPKASLPEPGMAGWLALSLVATFSYALRAVLVPLMRPPATTSLSLASGLLVAATAIMLAIMAVSGQWWAFGGEFGIGHWATVGGMLNNALLLVLIFEVIRLAGPVFFGGVNYISMLVGVALGIAIFNESHTLWVWLAIALVLAGLYLVNRGKAG
ncbi:MAG: DMT family transporter [Alphaproteobacteria bacterium]|nr:DMT family transporter [Alphaproteobacteria bacterium]MDP6588824.1 DMT family transporter [Alphaproteobacteria bacterium]MDP6819343.1 DMT family transporter [Alphaproteobacteria bacterium]